MKKIKVEDAVGMELCHDVTAIIDGFKGAMFKRGHMIEQEDIAKLLSIGKKHIYAWEDTAGEVHEEDCAARMAAANPVAHTHYSSISEGKVTLISDVDGMFRVDRELLKKLNYVPDVTITSLTDHYPVKEGERLASMRIVPLVTKEENIIEVERLCKDQNLFQVYPYKQMKAGVIITGSEVYYGRIQDKFEPVVRRKLAAYPGEIVDVKFCDDDLDMLLTTAKELLDKGVDLLVFHGGMSVDPDDLTPTAIRSLGAEVITYGVPAQPGNMSLVAYLGDCTILGVPSAAIKVPTTMFDVLLPQCFAGVKFTKDELMNLGDGGLCRQCKACHYPNCMFGKY